MAQPLAADHVELDGAGGDFLRRVLHAVRTQERHMLHPGGLCFVEERRDVLSEVETPDRGDQVDPVDGLQSRGVAATVTPVEVDVGTGPSGGADRHSTVREFGGDAGAGLAGRAEDKDCRMFFVHASTL